MLLRATGIKTAGVAYASTVGTAIQTYETTTVTAREHYLSTLMNVSETAAEATLRADRDKEIALADADLQKQLTGNESAHTTAVNNANSAHSTATANAEAARKSAEQAALTQLNSTLAQATKDKEASIAGAERTYDQAVASLDAQYGSESSKGDTGIEGATRRSAIKTRDAQYYAARDTSWANTLSSSTTLGTSPWTVKAISAANSQAAYSTSRANAQAAHDAAMLDAIEDWQLSSRESLTDLLFTEGQSRETYNVATSNVYANWQNGAGNLLGDKPEGTEWEGDALREGGEIAEHGNSGANIPNASGFVTRFDESQASEEQDHGSTEHSKALSDKLPTKKKLEPGEPGYAMQELTDRMDEDMKKSHLNMINPMSHAFFPVFLCKCAYTGVFIESRVSISAAHDDMRASAAKAAEESESGFAKAGFNAIGYGLNAQESFLLATNRFAEGGMLMTPIHATGLTPLFASRYVAVPVVGYGGYSYGTKLYEEGITPENFGDGILLGAGLLQVSRQPSLIKPTVGSKEQLLVDNAESIPLEKVFRNAPINSLNAETIRALRAAGLNDAAIARHLEVLGDIHVFRGTTEGFAGNPVLQRIGLTPTSVDPVVATAFASEGASKGVNPLILFGPRSAFCETLGMGNVRSLLEMEVSIGLTPSQFAATAPNSVSLARARAILAEMGIEVPTSMYNADAFLRQSPRLTPEQIRKFIERASQ